MKPGYVHHSILLAVVVLSLLSCSDKDPANTTDAVPVVLSIEADEKIANLRIMAFDVVKEDIKYNFYYSGDITTVTLNMHAGRYNFFFMANEPGESFNSLESIRYQSGLSDIQIPSSDINSVNNIPMTLYVANVMVLPGRRGVITGGSTYADWPVALEHLAVEFDLVLKSEKDLSSNFIGVEFYNLPDNVPVTGNYSGTHTKQRTFIAATDTEYFADTTVAGYQWAKAVKRIILPPNEFSPVNQIDRLVGFTVLTSDNLNPGCTFAMDEANGNYTMAHNTHFIVNAVVDSPMEVNIDIQPWDNVSMNVDMAYRILSVTALTASITDKNRARIYFASNQPAVSIDPTGYQGADGTLPFTVSSVFNNSLTYNSATGLGYVDIAYALSGLSANDSYIHRIYLNAGGLRREITVNTFLPESPPVWSATSGYVGTFHRWNQTGERIIYALNTGAWSATVVQGNFIILSSARSFDPNLGTATPNSAESYQVVDNTATTVSGTGGIYFRVGLTGTLASETAAPRYGLIRVTYDGGTSDIYVRQGEAPAVINSTVKWSVRNLSDPLRGLGGNDVFMMNPFTPQSFLYTTSFADFPSQVGYMFQWNLYDGISFGARRVYHPRNPLGVISGYPSSIAAIWDTENDPCPTGYRHPTGAEFTTLASNANNSIWGYYADGFFDRRAMAGSANVTGAQNYAFGAYGRVFFNAATNASVFFPAAGHRINNGSLQDMSTGNYCTSSMVGSNPNILLFSSSTVTPNDGTHRKEHAFSVRCIQR